MIRTLAVAALTATALASSTAPAHAVPTLCYRVWKDGTLPPGADSGTICVPLYEGPVNCQTVNLPVTSLVVLHASECVPR